MAAWACEEKSKFQDQLATYQKEMEVLKKQMTDHQVSPNGFIPIEDTIFCFHHTFLRETELVCCAF